MSLYNSFQNSGHLQAKWVKGSGKSEKGFMGGKSFLGVASGDGGEMCLNVGDFHRGARWMGDCRLPLAQTGVTISRNQGAKDDDDKV